MDLKINSNSEHRITNYDNCYDKKGRLSKVNKFTGYYWDHFTDPSKLDKPLVEEFHDKDIWNFAATMFFAYFRGAIHVTVEVSLIDEEPTIDVYELICASNDMITDANFEN